MARISLHLLLHTVLSIAPAVRSFTSQAVSARHHAVATSSLHPQCRRSGSAVLLYATSIWKGCAQPRFDEFASYTVGPWIATSSSSSSSVENAATPVQEKVEEVMRSCGGAVQGIRELPLFMIFPKDDADENAAGGERAYHNRADGGFVYADDGSYSAGPEKWDFNASDDERLAMASLAFPEDQRRMWLTVKLSEASETSAKCNTEEGSGIHQIIPTSRALEISRPWNIEDKSTAEELKPSQLPNVNWVEIQRVRMPNSNQAWSLARAKWEKQAIEADTADEDNDADQIGAKDEKTETGPLFGWSFIESLSGDEENALFDDAISTDAINLHMLAVCNESGAARSVVRCYDASDGSLKSVAFLRGSLSSTDE